MLILFVTLVALRIDTRSSISCVRTPGLSIAKTAGMDARELYSGCEIDLMNHEVFAFLRLDLTGKIVAWNRAAELITGFSKEEALGKQICLFFTPEDVALGIPDLELKNALEHGRAEDERWQMKKDGTRFWAVGAVTPTKDANGKILGLNKIFRDDTVRRNTEDGILSANAELNRFAYSAAHDLLQPLRTLHSFIELAVNRNRQKMDLESKEYLKIALDAAKRMRTLISDLLAYSQATQKAQMVEKVDVNAAMEIAVANLKVDLDATGAIIAQSPLPVLPAIPSLISQLLQNLISNALKYRSKNTPHIEITCERKEEHWLFKVADNGIGIEKESLERIFGVFERAHSQNQPAGSGLGLAICRNVVERHGGKIWVESEPGKGATFFFTLKA